MRIEQIESILESGHINQMDEIPAAACSGCGGWTSSGGCSQHRDSDTPVFGRTGCFCFGGKTGKRRIEERALRNRCKELGYQLVESAGNGQFGQATCVLAKAENGTFTTWGFVISEGKAHFHWGHYDQDLKQGTADLYKRAQHNC